MKKNLLTFVILMLISISISAQDRTITGTVKSGDDNSPLPGVNVVVKKTANGVITDADGKFKITVSADAILIFSYLGFTPQEIMIGNRSEIDVTLQPDLRNLTEVVVVGYGTQNKRDVTGSIATIKGNDITNVPVQSFDQALQGRAAGVNITTPNGVMNNPPVIRIRGINSINLSSFPLVVVDGVPTFTGDNSSNSAANNPLANINPADIESVDVLKDASASAIYGSRASAGVILITTKRGSKGKAKVNYDGWVGWTKPFRLFDLLNAQEYMTIKNEALKNNGQADGFFPTNDASGNPIDTDWYSYVYRTGLAHSHNVSFSGGSDATTYYASVGFTRQEGMLKNNSFDRLIGKLNIDHKISEKFKIGISFNYSNSLNKAPNTGSVPGQAFNTGGLGRLPLVTAPNVGPYLADGNYNISGSLIGTMSNTQQSGFYNPVVILDKDYFNSDGNQVQGSAYVNYEVIKGLNLRSMYSINSLNVEDIGYQSPLNGDGFTSGGVATNANRKTYRWNWQNTIQYDFSFLEKNNFSILVGGEQQYTTDNRWGAQRTTSSDDFFNTFQGNFTNIVPSGNFQGENYLISYFGRANYDFDKKYFATFNLRRDGYSAFAEGNKYGNFYGGSLGYSLSEENFWKDSFLGSTLNFFKVRASYGKVGNFNGVGNFASFDLYNPGLYGSRATFAFSQAPNKELTWETSTKTDIGFSFGLLNDKISGEFAYYNNEISDIILDVPQSPSKGIPGNTISKNIGSMVNKGIEFSIRYTPIRTNDFSWTINANITTLKNKVTSLDSDKSEIRTATSGLETANITKVGYPIGSIIAIPTLGVNPDNGRRLFRKADGTVVQYNHAASSATRWTTLDGVATTAPSSTVDAQIYGPTIPTFYGGFDNTFKYKGFDLGIFIQFSGGNYIYNGTKAGLRDMRFWNNHTDVLNRWTPENPTGTIPRVVFGDNVSNGSSFPISENVEKGGFIRGRNISLGYTLNNALASKLKIGSARVYVQMQNAFLISNYEGIDPEISTNGNSNITPGIDRNSVGQARTLTLGLNLGF